jgi:hypothetical protein
MAIKNPVPLCFFELPARAARAAKADKALSALSTLAVLRGLKDRFYDPRFVFHCGLEGYARVALKGLLY